MITWTYARSWCVALLIGAIAGIACVIVDAAVDPSSISPLLRVAGVLVLAAWPIMLLLFLNRLRVLLRQTSRRRCLRCNYPLAKGRSGCSECGEDFWWERGPP